MFDLDQVCHLFRPIGVDDDDKRPESPFVLKPDEDRVSPFIAYADGYTWPNVFTEMDEMMEASVVLYPLVELRRLAREKKIDDDSILTLPLTYVQIMEFVEKHRADLSSSKYLSQDFYVDMLQTAEERNMICHCGDDNGGEGTGVTDTPEKKHRKCVTPSSIVACDDEFENTELVYTVTVNHIRQRVVVCFRGSVTKLDWATNYEIYMKDVSNPMKAHSSQEPTIRIHNGFYTYLFGPSRSFGVILPNGERASEYDEIMQKFVLPVIKEYPDYKLYVTGHSLGAALATLFAFMAASEPDAHISKPVSLISFGGPYVGDESFRSAHQLLESLGKLRSLRVANHKDMVPLVPKVSFRWKFYDRESHVGALFKHVGMNLRLFEGTAPLEISFPKVRSGIFTSFFDELSRSIDQSLLANWTWNPSDYWKWPCHSLKEYNRRILANRPPLDTLYLNDLYSRKDIVGNLVHDI